MADMVLIKAFGVFLGAVLAFMAVVYVKQDGMMFIRQGLDSATLTFIKEKYGNAVEVRLKAADGVELHGWLLKGGAPGPAPLMIYFGGNAEEVSWMIGEASRYLKGWSLLLMNYRGYGLSGGRPGEKALLSDAELIYDAFVQNSEIDPGIAKSSQRLKSRS